MWKPYVPVAKRRQQAAQKMAKLQARGVAVQPVSISGRTIARSFWGKAWCEHLESFSDYANRLPRGRTYVRNGSVCHLGVTEGAVEAKVSGSSLYNVKVTIKTLPTTKWGRVKKSCAGRIGSLLGLLKGDLSDDVMAVVTDRADGLFPNPNEIKMACDCPDWAGMCKHIAAVLYGVGARLDEHPELLFLLRGVNHEDLIDVGADAVLSGVATGERAEQLAAGDLSEIFGIDLDPTAAPTTKPVPVARKKKTARAGARKKTTGKVKPNATVKRKADSTAQKKTKPASRKK